MRTAASMLLPVLCLIAAACGCAVTARGALADSVLWATNAMDRVMRDRVPGVWEPEIHAARGEWEALQMVLSGPPGVIKDALITSGSLKGPDGELIAAPVLLREHYVAISKSSELAPLPPGEYPDALVPQTFAWQELPTAHQVSQPFWIDVYVPPDAKPGVYSGMVTATLTDGQKLVKPFKLHVWDFNLPRLPSLKSSIFIVWRRIAKIHGFPSEGSHAEPALQRILDAYYDMLTEHRVSPHEIWAAYPDGNDPLSEKSYAAIEAALKHHLRQRQAGMIGLPLWPTWPVGDPLGKDRAEALRYAVRYYSICEKLGCADRLYKIFGELDEPNTKEQYELVRQWGGFFKELKEKHDVKIPLMVTEQIKPDDESWGRLEGSVDIWVPHVGEVWQDLESAHPAKEIPKRLAKGEEVWTYTALVQTPEEWKKAHGNPSKLTHGQPPAWLTDYPPMNYRILGWLAPRHHITGLTYWDTSFWKGDDFDVWSNNGTYPHDNDEVYNGDGFLIYPANIQRQGQAGPVASIRLKWIRESMDDHDYLALMQKAGFQKTAIDTAQTFARGFGDWDDDVPALYAARKRLGELLERLNSHHSIPR